MAEHTVLHPHPPGPVDFNVYANPFAVDRIIGFYHSRETAKLDGRHESLRLFSQFWIDNR